MVLFVGGLLKLNLNDYRNKIEFMFCVGYIEYCYDYEEIILSVELLR